MLVLAAVPPGAFKACLRVEVVTQDHHAAQRCVRQRSSQGCSPEAVSTGEEGKTSDALTCWDWANPGGVRAEFVEEAEQQIYWVRRGCHTRNRVEGPGAPADPPA